MSDGVGEVDAAIEIRLPVLREHSEIIFPAASVEAFADSVRDVSGRRRRG